jgi:hypothetical protein
LDLLAPNRDARVFEIVSFAILKLFYHDQSVYFDFDLDKLTKEHLKLFKTGRTNANDGGIDFVMKLLGRFFQVTETLQGVWLAGSENGAGLEEESEDVGRVAMVMFEEMGQRLALLEGDARQQDVAGERQIEGGVGLAMAVAIFLPGAGVALVVVAGFHRPVPTHRLGRALLLAGAQAGEEVAGVALGRLERVVLFRPVALDEDGRAGSR